METEQTKTTVFSKIRTPADAVKIIKDCALALYVIAGVQLVMGAVGDRLLFATAAVLIGLTFWLRSKHSRLAAMTILVSAVGIGIMVLVDQAGLTTQRLALVGLALVVLWLAIRSVQATFFLERAEEASESE